MKSLPTCFFLICLLSSRAQFPNVLISTLNDPEEVSIAINPKNTNQIVAGANLDNSYISSDAGHTWTAQTITCPAYEVFGDPVLIWDTANTCYYIHLSNPNPSVTPGGSWVDRIVIQSSANFGQSYNGCSAVGKNGNKVQDKAWAVVNPANNELHITWTQFDVYGANIPGDSTIILYSKSSNSGATWSTPLRISSFAGDCIDSDNSVEGAVPAIGPNGEIYVAWAGPKGLVFQKSTDGGLTWLPNEKVITSIPGGWDYSISGLQRANGLPFTFCDLSNGPHKGTIYINWSDHRSGQNDGDIWLVKSTDGGNTWSAPLRVNDDVPGKEQFMSAMTIDQATGYVYVLFYDRRNFSSTSKTDVYMAVSKNGGAGFANYKVNTRTFSPNTSVFFGDYIGISAHNNVVRPIWMQLNNDSLSVYTAIINPLTLGSYESAPPAIELPRVKPNPFSTELTASFRLKTNTALSVQLIDKEGKIMAMLAQHKEYPAGENIIRYDTRVLDLAKGFYYLVFYDEKKSRYVKLIKE